MKLFASRETPSTKEEVMHMPSYSHAGYLENIIQVEKLRVLIPKVIKALEKYDFDTLAFRGMSGTLIGPSVALAME